MARKSDQAVWRRFHFAQASPKVAAQTCGLAGQSSLSQPTTNLPAIRAARGGVPGAFVDHQRDAKDFWRRVELAMGTRDWQICRRVCAEGCTVAETVQAISPGYKFSTLARFREALDALVEGMAAARKR
jgi:hypothetical protein